MAHAARTYPVRAPRFPLTVPVHFRASGMSQWLLGKTVNISRTGILFQTDQGIPTSSVLDIRVDLPAQSTISCQASVVRTEKSMIAVQLRSPNLSRQP